MKLNHFLSLRIDDKVYDKQLKEIGVVQVCSRGEVYVEYPSKIGELYGYDISEDKKCYEDLMLVGNAALRKLDSIAIDRLPEDIAKEKEMLRNSQKFRQ